LKRQVRQVANFSFFRKKEEGEKDDSIDIKQSRNFQKADNTASFLTTGELFDPQNPFALGRREFNDRYERLVKNANSWRKLAFLMFVLLAASVGTVLWMAQSVKVVPYIVQVDRHGYDIAIKPVEQSRVTDDRIIIARLAEFILNVRTVYSDPAATMTCVKRAYNSITSRSAAQNKLDAWFRENNPLAKKEQSVSVNVQSVIRLAPNNNASWQIEWSEKTYLRGVFSSERFFKGVFLIEMQPPTNVGEIMLNPLGVFISDFDVTEKISSTLDSGSPR
jgi:type IV secretion system protein VirB5